MRAALLTLTLLAGCASQPRQEEVPTVPLAALSQQLVPGQTTREQARVLAEPAQRIRFDSGYEAWLYHYPTAAGPAEYVVLFAPSGIIAKTRRREP